MPPVELGPLIGRDRELEILTRALASATRGTAATVVIEGEAGIGKTRLLSSVAAAARDAGVTPLRGGAHPLEHTRPFGPLLDALELRPGSPDARRAAIGRLLLGKEGRPAGLHLPGELQFRVVEEIIDLLEVMSDEAAVLLTLDDVHWADSATLLAVRWIMKRLTSVPLLLVVTLRPLPRSPELEQLLEDAAQSATTLRVEALPDPHVEELIAAELGIAPGPELAEVTRRAGGNPLWVVEIVRSLSAQGRIDVSGASARLLAGELPGTVRQLVARRLRHLPEPTVKALRTASLFGENFSLTDMATVTGRRVTDLVDDLGPAFADGLVADDRGVLVFRHQLVRDAIYEEIPHGARVALHREIADALAAVGAPLEKIASHLMLGAIAPDAAAAASLRGAAAEAAPSAPGVAVELLRCAWGLFPAGHAELDAVLTELVECLFRIGNAPEAADIAGGVLGRPHDARVDKRLRFALIGALSLQRRSAELITQADMVLAGTSEMTSAERAHAFGLKSLGRVFSGDPVGGEADARRGLELAEQVGDDAMMSRNLTALGQAVNIQGRYGEGVEAMNRAVALTLDPTNPLVFRAGPYMMQGMALRDADRLDEAAAAYKSAAEECARLTTTSLLADIQLLAAEVRLLRGEWDDIVPEIEGGIAFAREHGNLITLPRFHAHLAIVAATKGDVGAGEQVLAPFVDEFDADHPCLGSELVVYASALLAEVAGHDELALARLQRFWDHDYGRHNRDGDRFIAPAFTRLALTLGQPELAREGAERAERAVELAGGVPSVESAALRCRGLIDRDPTLMLEAAELALRSGRALDHAGACEDAASVLAARGATGEALGLLDDAIARYEALGALWLSARATAGHRTLGGRRGTRGQRARAVTGWTSLSASECAVAELVAEGLTNREIGARLFISPHTVNNHLRRIFQKLDVSTRAGLAAKVPGVRTG